MRSCAFCHREAKMSGEHIWSEWIGKVLGGSRRYAFRRVDPNGRTLNTWNSDELDLTAKVVCEPCNNGWMSDIERDHAKPTFAPIIDGEPFCLLPLGIKSAAIWAFKITVIADHIQSNRLPFFTEIERTIFKERLDIPAGVQMWLAAYSERITYERLFVRSDERKGIAGSKESAHKGGHH